MPTPTVSILMTAYNAEAFLWETLETVAAQTYSDFELVIVDDGSSDGTRHLAEEFARADSRTVVCSNGRMGRAGALNFGLTRCRGEFVAILDADDLAKPERIALQAAFLRRHGDVVLLGTACDLIDEHGNRMGRATFPSYHAPLVWRLEHIMPSFPTSSVMARRAAMTRAGAYSQRYVPSEDWDMYLRLSRIGRVACLTEPLTVIRKHSHGISNLKQGRQQLTLGVAATICHLLRKNDQPDPHSMNDEDWARFLGWLEPRLDDLGHFEDLRRWQLVSSALRRVGASPAARLLLAARQAAREPPGALVLRWRTLGSPLPRRLAREFSALAAPGRPKTPREQAPSPRPGEPL